MRQRREALGLSQIRLAVKAGVAVRTLVRIEQGEDTNVGTLAKVADALEVRIADLFDGANA